MRQWDALAEGQPLRHYQRGQLIYLQNDPPQVFYYLVSGRVRSYLTTIQGEERTLAIHKPGDLMGEAAFFDQCPRVSSAVALEDSAVVPIDRPRLDALFVTHPQLAIPMLEHLARTVRLLSTHVDDTSLPALCRVARHLLSLPRQQEMVLCTHESIGQAMGISRITVSRVVGQLRREGILSTGYGSITLLDLPRLEQLAEISPVSSCINTPRK